MKWTNIDPMLITRIRAFANDGLDRLRPWLFERLTQAGAAVVWARDEARTRWPGWRERVIEGFLRARDSVRPDELRKKFDHARTWALLHDTVPPEATARLRERWIDRQHRREKLETERRLRQEELTKKREKKDVEERQTYSVFFE